MIELPPELAAQRRRLEGAIIESTSRCVDLEKALLYARQHQAEAEAELRGLDTAAAAFADRQAGDLLAYEALKTGSAVNYTKKTRKPRRDIQAQVKAALADNELLTPFMLAQNIGCRVSQVEAALKAINGAGE